jgi:uncharacterized protein (DUF1499 family)
MVRSSDVQSDQVGLSLSHIAVCLFEPPDFRQAAIAVRVAVVGLDDGMARLDALKPVMRRLVLEQPPSRAAIWSVRMALFAVVVTLYGTLLVRSGQQGLPGLAALGSGFVLAALSILVALVGGVMIWNHGLKGVGRVSVAIMLCLGVLAAPATMLLQLARLPALSDITTDIDDPPAFSRSRAALAARGGLVPPERPRESRQPQREAYQRIIPIITELPAEEAFDTALTAARDMGWQVIEGTVPGGRTGAGRIDAIATTRILRFADDVTIRIRPRVDGSRIDVRSVSRLGRHDLGTNARRIQSFRDEVHLLLAR